LDIAAETREFRDAITDWAKGYAASRRVALQLGHGNVPAEDDLRRWARSRISQVPANDTTGDPTGSSVVATASLVLSLARLSIVAPTT